MLLRNQLYAGTIDVREYGVRDERGDFEPLITLDGSAFVGTAATAPAFSYLQPADVENEEVVGLTREQRHSALLVRSGARSCSALLHGQRRRVGGDVEQLFAGQLLDDWIHQLRPDAVSGPLLHVVHLANDVAR